MNKTIIYAGLGAVAAFLLYKKFMAKSSDVEETKDAETETDETEAEGEAGGAPIGGGGGSSAPAPSGESLDAKEKKTVKTTTQSEKCGCKTGQKPCRNQRCAARPKSGVMKGGALLKKPNQMVKKPMKVTQTMSRPMAKPIVRPIPASKPVAKFAGFMDFDGFPDVQSNIM